MSSSSTPEWNVLHLSDPHLSDSSDPAVKAKGIASAVRQSGREGVDFIAITGDIRDRNSSPEVSYPKMEEFLGVLGEQLLVGFAPSKVLIVPGNDDWAEIGGFSAYNAFVRRWYGNDPNVKLFARTEDPSSPLAGLVNAHNDMAFLLLNSYWQSTTRGGRLRSGSVGSDQFAKLEGALRANGVGEPPRYLVALVHQHVLPCAESDAHEFGKRYVRDFASCLNWMQHHRAIAVLHGHRHSPVFHVLGSDDLSSVTEPGYHRELVVVGAGTCRMGDGHHDPREVNQFLLLHINTRRRPFLDSAVEATPFRWNGATWSPDARAVESHQTHSSFQKSLVAAEEFTCDLINEASTHPFRFEHSDDWFWNVYRDRWRECSPLSTEATSSTQSFESKFKFLKELVDGLRTHNRRKSVFEMLPFQLDGVYTYSALLFNNRDIEEGARQEFHTPTWAAWLRFNSPDEHPRWNHLDWANWIIASEVRQWVYRSGLYKIGIVDLGFGLLRTIDAIGKNLPAFLTEHRYLGIDVNPALVGNAKDLVGKALTNSPFFIDHLKTKPFDNMEFFLESSGLSYWTSPVYTRELKGGGFNLFVTSYSMHHSSNSFRARKSLEDGTFFSYIGHPGGPGLKQHLEAHAPVLFSEAEPAQLGKLFEALMWLGHARRKTLHDPAAPPYQADASAIAERIDQVVALGYPDGQATVYRAVYDALDPGGMIAIADPNGMSRTFNRQIIFTDPAIAIAHFSDWPEVVAMLAKIGFTNLRVYRQIRLNNLQVRRVQVPPSAVDSVAQEKYDTDAARRRSARRAAFHGDLLGECYPMHRLDIPAQPALALELLDQHMGYIVLAEKPKSEEMSR